MSDVVLIGRDREVAQLELAIGPVHDGLRLAMLSGPSGLGKTTLASVITTRAAERGFRVATVRGRAGSLSTPFAPFIDAVPEFEALLAVLASDRTIDLERAGTALVSLLAELTTNQPLLLVFDDAQALDESSIALLPYLSGVSERMDLTLLFIEQTDAIGVPSSYRAYIDGVLSRRVVGHLRLGPMSDDSVRQVVAHELGLSDPAEVPSDLVERAGGNPWFAKELAHGWQSGNSEIPTTISAAATARLHALGELEQDVVSAIALCIEGAHLGWLEVLADQRPRQFVRTMESISASGLVRNDGEIYTIAHPLMQQALVDELSMAMRRAIHLELADVIASVPLNEVVAERARGQHLQAAGRTDDAVTHFVRAAQANEIVGQLHEAYADLVRALDCEPRTEQRVDLLRRTATLAMQVDRDAADTYWNELGRIAASQGDDETYAYALFQQYWTCNDGNARDRLTRAAGLGVDRLGWSARAAANIASLEGRLEQAEQHDRTALRIAREKGDTTLEALTMHRLGVAIGLQGRLHESVDVLREAVSLAVRHRHHAWAVVAWGDLADHLANDMRIGEAVSETNAALRYVDDLGLDRMRPIALSMHASMLMRTGDLESARGAVERAIGDPTGIQWSATSPMVASIRAELLNELGVPGAAEAVATAVHLIEQLGYASWREQLRIQEARVALMQRRTLDAALEHLRALDALDEPVMLAEAALWLTRMAALHSHAAGLEFAKELRLELGSADTARYVDLVRRELDAVFAAVDGAPTEALSAIAEEWEQGGRALDALRVLAVSGAIDLAAGRRERAKVTLKAAKDGLATCGASTDADYVASLLRQTGARSRAKSRTTNVGPLTKRELEIARHVARGLRNSEVASTLFLAEKTVAAHLSNIYGKVEVRSRVQLTAWIREHDPEFEASLSNAG